MIPTLARIVIGVLLIAFGGWFCHIITRSLRQGSIKFGAITRRRTDAFYYWLRLAAFIWFALVLFWSGLRLIFPDVIPPPAELLQ